MIPSLLPFARNQHPRPGRRPRRGALTGPEPLGERALPAVTSVTFDAPGGALVIRCDNAPDVVRVQQDAAGNILVNGVPARDATVANTTDISIYGNGGNDRLEVALPGYRGADLLDGSDGNDTLVGGNGRSQLRGGPNADDLTGGPGDDIIDGGGGVNRLIESGDVAFTLTDARLTGLGTDALAGVGRAHLTGGRGSHRYDASAFTGRADIDAGFGDDVVLGGRGDDTLFGGGGNDYVSGGGGADEAWGLGGNDWVIGGPGADTLYGNTGDDYLAGMEGDDVLDGGDDYDRIYDTGDNVTIDGRSMTIVRVTPGGTTAESDAHTGMEAGMLSPTGSTAVRFDGAAFGGPLDLRGTAASDTLVGGPGPDEIHGYGDDDLILGNAGDDWLVGDQGRDLLVGGSGADRLDGGPGEDVLIAGATAWDGGHNTGPWELGELFADWRRTDLDYEGRVADQVGGVGATRAALSPAGWSAGTLIHDSARDVLTGGRDLDVFFWVRGEDETDRNPLDVYVNPPEHWPGA